MYSSNSCVHARLIYEIVFSSVISSIKTTWQPENSGEAFGEVPVVPGWGTQPPARWKGTASLSLQW